MVYQINNTEELEEFFNNNGVKSSDDLDDLGPQYWTNTLKPFINPKLFKIPKTIEELKQLIEYEYPLLLIDTISVVNFSSLFKNDINNNKNLKTKEYWDNPLNYLGYWNTNNVVDLSYCFYKQKYFNQKLYWNTTSVKNAEKFFFDCQKLNKEIKLSLPNCKTIKDMFCNCKKLNSKIILKKLNNIVEFYSLFSYCEKLDFKNIKSIINQLVTGIKNINKLEKTIGYTIPEEYKDKINNKSAYVINQI